MIKVVINPQYSHLQKVVTEIPNNFDTTGKLLHKGRNTIKTFVHEGLLLNIKSYKTPIFINRIVYTFFRKSKAKRAFLHAMQLTSLGFDTPSPIAYIECFGCGLLNRSFFVSMHKENIEEFRAFQHKAINEDIENMLTQMAQYVAQLHNSNVLHLDFSPGNILIEKENGQNRFWLVDINRMQFKPVDNNEGMMNFGRLCLPNDKVIILAKSYAQARGINEDLCINKMLENNEKNKIKFSTGKERKQKILNVFKKNKTE